VVPLKKTSNGWKFFPLFISLSVCLAHAGDQDDQPNILFIMSDDHTAQAWSVYQSILQPYVQTPNIERLAREGCILQNAYATNSLCGPSRAAILTGQYSHRNNVYTNRDSLDPDTRHLAHHLQDAGYQTAIFCSSTASPWTRLRLPSRS